MQICLNVAKMPQTASNAQIYAESRPHNRCAHLTSCSRAKETVKGMSLYQNAKVSLG